MQEGSTPVATIVSSTITATTTTTQTQVGGYSSFVAYLNVSAISGTSASITVQLQDSPDGTTWYNIPSGLFTAVTTVTTQRIVTTQVGAYVRAVETVSGTTPSITATIKIVGLR